MWCNKIIFISKYPIVTYVVFPHLHSFSKPYGNLQSATGHQIPQTTTFQSGAGALSESTWTLGNIKFSLLHNKSRSVGWVSFSSHFNYPDSSSVFIAIKKIMCSIVYSTVFLKPENLRHKALSLKCVTEKFLSHFKA